MKTAITNIVRTVLITTSLLTVGFGFLPVQTASAVGNPGTFGTGYVQNQQGVSTQGIDPRNLAQQIINVLLGFLGIIAVGIILIAGFKWMTAGGADDKVTEAQTMLMQGVIGLIIIIAAWGLATWVIGTIVSTVGTANDTQH